jgi:interferon-induced transmembrane protein
MSSEPAPTAAPAPHPGYPPRPSEPSAQVGWAIAGMLLFWPSGIPAVLASHRAALAIGAGDPLTAARESANAKRWGIISVCVAAGLALLGMLFAVVWVFLVVVVVHDIARDVDWTTGDGWTNEAPFENSQQDGTDG